MTDSGGGSDNSAPNPPPSLAERPPRVKSWLARLALPAAEVDAWYRAGGGGDARGHGCEQRLALGLSPLRAATPLAFGTDDGFRYSWVWASEPPATLVAGAGVTRVECTLRLERVQWATLDDAIEASWRRKRRLLTGRLREWPPKPLTAAAALHMLALTSVPFALDIGPFAPPAGE